MELSSSKKLKRLVPDASVLVPANAPKFILVSSTWISMCKQLGSHSPLR